MLTRREFNRAALGAALTGPFILRRAHGKPADRIESIEHRGVLIGECTLPGETRKDDVVPAQATGIPVSRDRWLILYSTRGFRGVDDDRSIVYQLRKDAPDGAVIKEGFFARAREGWDPFDGKLPPGEGRTYFKQHGHPVVFGVPKGALVNGKPAAHANVFVAKWRVVARVLDKEANALVHSTADREIHERTQGVEWLQFRLNDRADDVEIIQPAAALRQKGHEQGPSFCSADRVASMNQSFTPAVLFTSDGSEWADCNHFDGGRVAALKYTFNAKTGRYEWTATGPFLGDTKLGLFEASLAHVGDAWVIAARRGSGSGVAWARTDDPFGKLPAPTLPKEPASNAPLTAFTSADGMLRLLTGDNSASPYRNSRDPLYCWDVAAADDFACSNRRVIFDTVKAKLPIRPAAVPKLDMAKLLPHQGRTQLVLHRVSVRSYNFPYTGGSGKPTGIPTINADEKGCCGLYFARITYAEEFPSPWQFARSP